MFYRSVYMVGLMTELRTFGQRLNHAMAQRNMRQVDLAKGSGVPKQTLSNWQKDLVKQVYPGYLIAVTDALAIRPQWLVNGTGQMGLSGSADPKDPDFAQLKYVVTAVISSLGRRVLSLPDEKVAKLVAAIYELQLSSRSKVETATIISLIRAFAD